MRSDRHGTSSLALKKAAVALREATVDLRVATALISEAAKAVRRPEPGPQRFGKITRVAEEAKACLTASAVLLVLPIGLLIMLAALVREIIRDDYMLDPMLIPTRIQQMGYTGEVVASRLADEIQSVNRSAHGDVTTLRAVSGRLGLAQALSMSSNSKLPDVEVPETGLSLRSVAQLIRVAFNANQHHVGGEIVETHNGQGAYLIVRLDTQRGESILLNLDSIDAGIAQAARQFVRLAQPCVFAAYAHTSGELVQASEAMHTCLQDPVNRRDASLQNLYGLVLTDSRQLAPAIVAFQRATELNPQFAPAYSNWGNALYSWAASSQNDSLGEIILHQATIQYERAIELDPRLAPAHNGAGQVLGLVGELMAAKAGLARRSGDSESAKVLADSAYEMIDTAITRFVHAIQLDSMLGVAHSNLGYALLIRAKQSAPPSQSDFDTARAALQRATVLAPRLAMAYNNLGVALFDQPARDERAAIEMYEKAMVLDSTLPQPFANMGEVLQRRGQCKQAKSNYEEAVRLDPGGSAAAFSKQQMRTLAC